MASKTVQIDWIRDHLFLMRDGSGFPIVMTQLLGVNAADLLPLSLIGCSVWDIITILQKQRQQVTNLQVFAESQRDDEPPWRFRKIHILYKFTGRNLDPSAIERAIELSETKYCAVHATLRDVVELSSHYEIVNE